MLRIFLKITLLLFLFLSNSFGDVVNSVDVLGNKRLSKESIMMFGKININNVTIIKYMIANEILIPVFFSSTV